MNFFEAQRDARIKTFLLLCLFIVLTALLSFLNAVLVWCFVLEISSAVKNTFYCSFGLFGLSAIFVLDKLRETELSKMLGGELLGEYSQVDSKNAFKDRQLINIISEMSLASGAPIPKCAVLRKINSINAFVTGTEQRDIIITVTQGALDQLNRDELQAVIAHEFSHILNQDLILNLRITAVVASFVVLWGIAYMIIRTSFEGYIHWAVNLVAVVVGFCLFVIGSLGLVLGRLVQILTSKQREYLADASAIQFTRNPEALACALAKISNQSGSVIESPLMIGLSHICFSDPAEPSFFGSLLSPHPSVKSRIGEIYPGVKASDLLAKITPAPLTQNSVEPAPTPMKSKSITNLAGSPNEESFRAASAFMASIGLPMESINNHESALALLELVMVYSQSDSSQSVKVPHTQTVIPAAILTQFEEVIASSEQSRVMLLQIVLSKLSDLPTKGQVGLLTKMRILFEQDGCWSLREALIYLLTERCLNPIGFIAPINMRPNEELIRWFNSDDSVNFNLVREFILGWRMAPLIKRKELLESILHSIEISQSTKKEEFRILAIIFGIPMPLV